MNSRRKTAAGASPAAGAAAPIAASDGSAEASAPAPLAEVLVTDVAVAMPIDGILQLRREMEERDPEERPRNGVRVVGPRAGRRRAGRAFGPDPVDIDLLGISEDDLRAIDADPLLALSLVQLAAADDDVTEG